MDRSEPASVGRYRTMLAVFGVLVFALASAGCGDDSVDVTTTAAVSGPVADGQRLAGESCSGCHGPQFEGIDKLGPALTGSAFIQDHSDAEIVDFIKEGRAKNDPDNDTGIAMPPYGGNPRLTDDDLADIVTFLRTLQ